MMRLRLTLAVVSGGQTRPPVAPLREGLGVSESPRSGCAMRSLRQRIGPHLDVYDARSRTLTAFHQPRRAVAVRAPQPAALPARVGVVDAPIQTLGEEAERVRDAQHDHLPVLEGGEAVVQVGGRDG